MVQGALPADTGGLSGTERCIGTGRTWLPCASVLGQQGPGAPATRSTAMLRSFTFRIAVAPLVLVLTCEASVLQAACMEAPEPAHEHGHAGGHGSADTDAHSDTCEMPCCDGVPGIESACSRPEAVAMTVPAVSAAGVERTPDFGIRWARPPPATRERPPILTLPPPPGRQALLSTFLM